MWSTTYPSMQTASSQKQDSHFQDRPAHRQARSHLDEALKHHSSNWKYTIYFNTKNRTLEKRKSQNSKERPMAMHRPLNKGHKGSGNRSQPQNWAMVDTYANQSHAIDCRASRRNHWLIKPQRRWSPGDPWPKELQKEKASEQCTRHPWRRLWGDRTWRRWFICLYWRLSRRLLKTKVAIQMEGNQATRYHRPHRIYRWWKP